MIINVYIVHIICVIYLSYIAIRKDVENAIPAFCFMIILIPTEAQVQLSGLFSLTLQRTVLLTMLIFIFFLNRGKKAHNSSGPFPLKYLILISIIWGFFSIFASIQPLTSFKRFLAEIGEYTLLFYILVKTISNNQTIKNTLIAIVLAMSFSALFGTVEAYRGWSIASLFPETTGLFEQHEEFALMGRGYRTSSTFPHAILFGGALAIAIPLTLYLLSLTNKWQHKTVLLLSLALMFISIYKTMSRGPWIALILSLIILFIFSNTVMRKYIVIIFSIALITLISRPGVWDTLYGLWDATFDTETALNSSYEYRYALFRVARHALDQSSVRQFFGYGSGTFYDLQLEGEFRGRIHNFLSCDSSWISMMIGTGYVGLIIALVLFSKITFITWQNFRFLPSPYNTLCLVIFSNLIAFFFLMTNVSIYGWGQNGHFIWILISLAIAAGRVFSRIKEGIIVYK